MDRVAREEQRLLSNQNAADILTDLIKKGICVQDEKGDITVPSASKKKHREDQLWKETYPTIILSLVEICFFQEWIILIYS